MTDLIACFSTGPGTGAHVLKVIDGMQWGAVYLFADKSFEGKIPGKENMKILYVDPQRTIAELSSEIKAFLDGKISDLEVGVNFVSGSGKEHMALLLALLELGLGIRLVALTKEGVKVL
ncbi:hypothetical protein HYV84_05685 [Candidatus Woesearchaeota archaeon]|nr:hypothetical protein [Candidatus Woesearchaeota archaeon]